MLADDSGVQRSMEKPWQVIVSRDINHPEGDKKKQELKEESRDASMAVPKSAQTRIVVIITYTPMLDF